MSDDADSRLKEKIGNEFRYKIKALGSLGTDYETLMDELKAITTEARTGEVHEAFGFASWPLFVADAVGDLKATVIYGDIEKRRELVAFFTNERLTPTVIARIVGFTHHTVRRDQATR